MNKQKLSYTVPVAESLVIRFEERILDVTSPAVANAMGLYDFTSSNGNIKDDSSEWGF